MIKKNGSYQQWYSNGKQHIKGNYKNEELNGLYEEWYSNGEQHIKGNYKDKKLDGLYEEWYLMEICIKVLSIKIVSK
jgi:antitoxin component YwqK of YwqJK toxin-antitoxin module